MRRNSSQMRRQELTLNNEPVCLAAREFQLLRYHIERPGTAISRTELLQAVWGYSAHSSTRTVGVHIASLRRRLEKDPVSPEMIGTIIRDKSRSAEERSCGTVRRAIGDSRPYRDNIRDTETPAPRKATGEAIKANV